jgi:hypothetical protein
MFQCLFNRSIKKATGVSLGSLKKELNNREAMLILEKAAPHFRLQMRYVNAA